MTSSFEEYVVARGPGLVRLARLLTGDPDRAEDLVQDVLARAYTRWSHIVKTEQPDLYVRRMLVNRNISWWRRRSSREVSLPDIVTTPASGEMEKEVAERLWLLREVAALPPRQRAVVVLRYYEDLEDARIAEILDCSVPTVRTHALRAVATIRQRLGVVPFAATTDRTVMNESNAAEVTR